MRKFRQRLKIRVIPCAQREGSGFHSRRSDLATAKRPPREPLNPDILAASAAAQKPVTLSRSVVASRRWRPTSEGKGVWTGHDAIRLMVQVRTQGGARAARPAGH